MGSTKPRPDVDDDLPVDPTPPDAGLSTTGLGATEIEHEMPPAPEKVDANEVIQREIEAERIDQVSDGEPV